MKYDDACSCQNAHLPSLDKASAAKHPRHESWYRQGLASLLSTLVLILMPKCPVCVAAWVTFFTGVGLSLTVAAWLRLFLMAISCVVLTLFVIVRLKHVLSARSLTGRVTFPYRKNS
ncbi:hypothetical protein [Gimesia sp.]|uniref:hypothetical protein n=1 Tax=Gimesia sp. TaxID=2024833 RepID=UPI000C43F267|nr:hypothetical protein [Gimesia sp.]MAX39773.1 hypothetical protein [Gimesia sp.]HAH45572.1 hypothetical protein [Planctomycetaceae bacterium]HBL42468.1 hypothetical protein [Planctomycetaceae bacterium]|tara:strand:+ start:39721 stop:40071 length:351 start_codon:yes stop_codon:yes gene_type:complete